MLKVRNCPKCSGSTVPDYEGIICLNCGHTDYSVNMGNSIKENKEGAHGLKLINTFAVKRKGRGKKAWASHTATVHIMSKTDSREKEYFKYHMPCPYTGCGEIVTPKRYARKEGDYTKYGYSCTVGHLWYLLVENQEPVYWRY